MAQSRFSEDKFNHEYKSINDFVKHNTAKSNWKLFQKSRTQNFKYYLKEAAKASIYKAQGYGPISREIINIDQYSSVGFVTNMDMAGLIWTAFLQSNINKALEIQEYSADHETPTLVQLVPKNYWEKSFVLVVLSNKISSTYSYILSQSEREEVENELFNYIRRKPGIKDEVILRPVYRVFSELDRSLIDVPLEILYAPLGDIEYLSSTPDPFIEVAFNARPPVYDSSVGVLASSKGNKGCTVCLHAFENIKGFGLNSKVLINQERATIKSVDRITDSCFAEFDDQSASFSHVPNSGPLSGISPRQGMKCTYSGKRSGNKVTAIINTFSPTIPYLQGPKVGAQQHVLTNKVTKGGDSGAALVEPTGNVVGFSFFKSGYNASFPYSAWIWAKDVYDVHNIT